MVDSVIISLSNTILAVLGVIVYIFLISSFLPYFTFKIKRVGKSSGDKGVKKNVFGEGRAITYFTSLNMQNIISQYTLIQKNEIKYIKCKINESVFQLHYDVITYDSYGKISDLISVCEKISERGYTHAVKLPDDTVYVELILKRVNEKNYTARKPSVVYNRILLLTYFVLVLLITYAEMCFFEIMIANLMNVFNITAVHPSNKLLSSVIVGGIFSALVIFYYSMKLNKVIRK